MRQYIDLVNHILNHGRESDDRTGVGTLRTFCYQMRFNLREGFPLVSIKKTNFHAAKVELLWMLRGLTTLDFLHRHNVHIWDEWADAFGSLGPVYGAQWRSWEVEEGKTRNEIDQLDDLITALHQRPFSRRHILTAWNPADLPDERMSPRENAEDGRMALAPCHMIVQFFVEQMDDGKRRLSCQLYQRSADVFLGVPFNIAGYALLTQMLAHHVDMEVGELSWTGGDCHLYLNHMAQVEEMLQREPSPQKPYVHLNYRPYLALWDVEPRWIELVGYDPHPAIKAPVAV